MAKVTYTNLKIKVNTDVKILDFNDNKIEVLQYLPIEDKNSLISITMQNSEEEGIYNPVKVDMFFHLYTIFMYTNISFTEKQKENPNKLYDSLKSSGLMDEVLKMIPEEEYKMLYDYLEELITIKTKRNKSVVSLIESVISDLPKQAEAAMNIVNNFDKNKFQEVINFAQAANGGRPIL